MIPTAALQIAAPPFSYLVISYDIPGRDPSRDPDRTSISRKHHGG